MKPVKVRESNFTYLGPNPEVSDLPCRVEGMDTYSVWELSDEDRMSIAKGGCIRLGIHGVRPIPPVSLHVVTDAGQFERETAPCDACGREGDDPVHGVGAGTHAYRSRSVPRA